ncbi:unnamed protein product [Thlaspi arvense]|uniref:Dof zinc finger protein n=1 Tax=Thlaspi arvense TaxID=13288 RepID=A0AAU9RUL4_THLAR|nr:unnamed protein product [Thlaspi arvense]
MDNSNVFVRRDNQVSEEKLAPPRICPRCDSENIKFCYYNNYSMSQPRYFCKSCRRYWTHGGSLRNIPIGGSSRRSRSPKMDQPSGSVEVQQVNHHQPFLHVQETNEFVGSFDGSSSAVVGNHFGLPEIHADMVTNVLPIRSFPPMEALDYSDLSFRKNYYDVGSSELVGNPLMNQPNGKSVVLSSGHDNYRVNEEDPMKWNESFNNSTSMNHNVNTCGSR